MDEKTLLITGFTDQFRDPTDTDNTMEEVFELTLPSKQQYTSKYGYDLLTLRSFSRIDAIFNEKEIGFLRVFKVFEMLNYYDNVMWIDADAIITNNAFDINYFIKSNKTFYASWDWNGYYSLNSGNFIIKKTEHTREFFNLFVEIGKYVLHNKIWGAEQTTFNIMYKNTQMSSEIDILDHSYLNSVPDCLDWEENRKLINPWSSNNFLAHLTGSPNQTRVKVLKNNLKQYL